MKTSSFCGILFLAATCLASCNQSSDVKMHTVVHRDGSCIREISYSNKMTQEVRDSLWGDTLGWSQPMPECLSIEGFGNPHTEVGEGDTVTTTFSCDYPSVEQMCEQTPLLLNGARLQSKARLEKHFRWFYTEYTFTEEFQSVGNTFKIPPTNYANQDVVNFWFTGQPNLVEGLSGAEASEKLSEMEPFVSKWLNDNLIKVVSDCIVNHYDSIPDAPVSRERFIELNDSLARFLTAEQDDVLNLNGAEMLNRFFHSDAYAMFFDDETPCGKEMEAELSRLMNIFWFKVPYTLSMPGTIIDAGQGTICGDIIFYPLTGERLIPHDYVITATSRATNLWAYIVMILVIALAVGSFFRRRKK